ncbi:hypothetical protein C8R44DRAFT_758018 [Mycena epipterygia]|nr:hypothetical protein C8R44DRAFT_758018 [Mycena epipterygia]
MIAAITSHAKAPYSERAERDRRALAWTLSSLNNDHELELFLETNPDVLWEANGPAPHPRRTNSRPGDYMLQGLLDPCESLDAWTIFNEGSNGGVSVRS